MDPAAPPATENEHSPSHDAPPPPHSHPRVLPAGPDGSTGPHGLRARTAREEATDVSMALVMSQMPDVWRKVLAEHVPDASRYCRECRNGGGQASWPCQTYRIAEEAKWVAEGNLPGTGPHGPGPSASPYLSPPEPPRRPDPLDSGPLRSGSFSRPEPGPSWGSPDPYRPDPYRPDPYRGAPTPPSYGGGHPGTGALPATGAWPAPGPSTGSYPTTGAHSGGFRPLAGDPLGTPYPEPAMSASRAGDQPYGSTFDAPYGASFGVDDRPRARY